MSNIASLDFVRKLDARLKALQAELDRVYAVLAEIEFATGLSAQELIKRGKEKRGPYEVGSI